MINKGSELLTLCHKNNKKISEIIIDHEIKETGMTYDEIMAKMKEVFQIMKASAGAGLKTEIFSLSRLTGGNAKKMEDYKNQKETVSGEFITSAMAKALSTSEVNASMGKIVAAPTAGASGIIPSVMVSIQEKLDLADEEIINALFTASGIGQIIAKNATVSGAEGGCQAECGVASAMGAGAITELMGGSPDQCLNAASFSLINIMGLVCDPIAGLVEYPCALRNASGVANAFVNADLALAKVQSLVPFDEVVEAMYQVGKSMPEALRETALGGLACTPSGEDIKRRLLR